MEILGFTYLKVGAETKLTQTKLRLNDWFLTACQSVSGYFIPRGARGVMFIVVGNGHSDTSSNPGRDWLHFT